MHEFYSELSTVPNLAWGMRSNPTRVLVHLAAEEMRDETILQLSSHTKALDDCA